MVEQVGDAAPMERGDGPRFTEAEAPEASGFRLLARVIHLVGSEDHGLVGGAQHANDVLVGAGGAHVSVDDEEHGVSQVDRDLGLGGDGGVDALGIRLPAAGVDEGEPASGPLALVGDPVAGDTRGVLDDGFATAENAVDQRRLAHVGAADDRENGKGRQIGDGIRIIRRGVEDVAVFLVEIVILEARTQRVGAHERIGLVEHGELLAQLGIEIAVFVVLLVVVVWHGGFLVCGLEKAATGLLDRRKLRPPARSGRSRDLLNRGWSHPRRRS